ncbi:hypothetical protein [Rossellomorea yichunensis]|uniref:hypothetical protein n=1 Tax=Rossellomorea yichunensis TaxID=3077331 RepID=UPI0028DE5B35|nr:hypothetical protein [Rossellomorea sp. YC4-1]MDT9027484.1 hypothetical protein [Rossellomorea sp. YC4-1]
MIARKGGGSGTAAGSGEEKAETEEKKKTSYKWVCPECGLIVRSTKPDIALNCMMCDKQLEEEE